MISNAYDISMLKNDSRFGTYRCYFIKSIIPALQGLIVYFQVEMHVNNRDIRFPNQLFINNQFVDASDGGTFQSINPTDESVSTCYLLNSSRKYSVVLL